MHGNINPTILVYFKLEACASIKVYLNIILYYICPPQLENYHRHHPYNCGTFLFIPDTSQISVMAQWQYVLLGMIKGLMGDHSCLVPILPQCSCSPFPYDEKKNHIWPRLWNSTIQVATILISMVPKILKLVT